MIDDYCRFSHGHFHHFPVVTDFHTSLQIFQPPARQVGDVWLQVEATEPTGLGLASVRGPRFEE